MPHTDGVAHHSVKQRLMARTTRHVIRDPDTGDILAATCTTKPLSDEAQTALADLARAVRSMWDNMPAEQRDEIEARQAAARGRNRERLQRLGM